MWPPSNLATAPHCSISAWTCDPTFWSLSTKIQKLRGAFNLDYLTQGFKAAGSIVLEIPVRMVINGCNLLYMVLLFHVNGVITDFELAQKWALHGARRQTYFSGPSECVCWLRQWKPDSLRMMRCQVFSDVCWFIRTLTGEVYYS
jgi:hypothetical protein